MKTILTSIAVLAVLLGCGLGEALRGEWDKPETPHHTDPWDKPDPSGKPEPKVMVDSLHIVVDSVKSRHVSKLVAVRAELSPEAVAAVESEIEQTTELLRVERDYHKAESLIYKLALLDVLLTRSELAELSTHQLLESMVDRGTLKKFLQYYSDEDHTWFWFFHGAFSMSPVNPDHFYSDSFLQNYSLRSDYWGALMGSFTDPSLWNRAGHLMENILSARTQKLIMGRADAKVWLEGLGFSELAHSLTWRERKGESRQEMLTNYLPLVANEKHRRHLRLLLPQESGKELVASMLLFTAGAEHTSFLRNSMLDLLDIDGVGLLKCGRGDKHTDRESFAVFTRELGQPDTRGVEWHKRQFAISF